jgi:hypothetical protein
MGLKFYPRLGLYRAGKETRLVSRSISANLMCFFLNGDDLSESDLAAIDETLAGYKHFHVRMPDDTVEPSFQRCDITGLWDNCYDCEVEVAR